MRVHFSGAGRTLTLAVAFLATFSCGGGGGGSTGPSGSSIATVVVSPTSATLEVGETRQFSASALDGSGRTVSATFQWNSSAGTVASVTAGSVVGLSVGPATIQATAGGRTGSAQVNVVLPQPPQAPVGVTAFALSDTEARVVWGDQSGNETGFTIARSPVGATAAPAEGSGVGGDEVATEFVDVATVGPNTTSFDDDGLTPGTGYLYQVSACNTAGCTAAGSSAEMMTFETLTVTTAALVDGMVGTPYQTALQATGGDGSFAWTIGSGALPPGLSLAPDGILSGIPSADGAFDVGLAVTGGGQTATQVFALTVLPGFNFAPDAPASPRVAVPYDHEFQMFGGTPPFTFSVSAGQLPGGILLDAQDGALSGTASTEGPTNFTVRADDSDGAFVEREFDLEVCAPVQVLAVGESRVMPFPNPCGIVLDGQVADYRVALIGRTPHLDFPGVPSATPNGLQLSILSGTPGTAYPAPTAPSPAPRVSPHRSGLDEETRALAAATEALHIRLREEEYRLYAAGAASMPAAGPPLEALGLAPVQPVDPTPTRSFWVSNPQTGVRSPVNATLRGFNESIAYYQDDGVVTANAAPTDQRVMELIDYYHTYGTPVINQAFGGLGPVGTTNNFRDGPGGPVLTLPTEDLDENGRLIVLQIRPSLMPAGAAAYVSSCDRLPRPENYAAGPFSCSGSNQAEITYLSEPTSAFYYGTVVHEAKHVASHGQAFYAGRGFNPTFIEEGTAEIAKELSSRDAMGVADTDELTFADVYPPSTASYGTSVVVDRSLSFLGASPQSGLIGNPDPNPNGSTYYGASWLFHRFLADQYAGGNDDAFFTALNTGGTDIEHIEVVVGKSFETLLGEFMAAIAVEGEPAAEAAAAQRFATYDFASMSAGFAEVWPYSQATRSFGAASVVTIPVTYQTAPNFVELGSTGSMPARLDLFNRVGGQVDMSSGAALVVTRIR